MAIEYVMFLLSLICIRYGYPRSRLSFIFLFSAFLYRLKYTTKKHKMFTLHSSNTLPNAQDALYQQFIVAKNVLPLTITGIKGQHTLHLSHVHHHIIISR